MARALIVLMVAAGIFVRLKADTTVDAVVAADGTGNYKTIQDAIDAVPQNTRAANRWVIAVRPGVYRERVYVQREKRFVTFVGDDPARVVITYDLRASKLGPDNLPIGTFRTPTVTVDADDFSAENITFENAAGPVGQALALRVDGDRVVFRNCRFVGWQDTVFLNRGRQYFEDSLVTGHVDFIFGGATAYFERPRIHAWRSGYITAASTPQETPYGFVFANGAITGETGASTYLGRPWRDFASVAFLNTQMSDVIHPSGWHNWDKPERERTSRYAEFGSRGTGARMAERVSWARRAVCDESASRFGRLESPDRPGAPIRFEGRRSTASACARVVRYARCGVFSRRLSPPVPPFSVVAPFPVVPPSPVVSTFRWTVPRRQPNRCLPAWF